jgi:hypothetical protein
LAGGAVLIGHERFKSAPHLQCHEKLT